MTIDIANLVVGIAGLVVGVAGIYFTVLSSPTAMKALGSVLSHTGLPPEFKGFLRRDNYFHSAAANIG